MSIFIKFIFFNIIVATVLSINCCGKYEYGPQFSLRSKKSRVAASWDINSIGSQILSNNGDSINWKLERSSNLTISEKLFNNGNPQTNSYSGSWEFASLKKQLAIIIDGNTTLYEIKRLTENEMWLDDDVSYLDGNIYKLKKKKFNWY